MQSYYLLLSAKSLIGGQQKKNYLLKIYQAGSETPYQIDNVFVHNYEYVYKLWTCQFQRTQTIRIKMYEKFSDPMGRQVIVKRGESQPQITYNLEGEKFKFYGEQADKCALILNFWVQTHPNLEKQIGNQQLQQINRSMQDHLANCRQELHQYQQFLTYTNKLIKELNNQEMPSRINFDAEAISNYQISPDNTQHLKRKDQEKHGDDKNKEPKQSGPFLKNIDAQNQPKQKKKQTLHQPKKEIVNSDLQEQDIGMEDDNQQSHSLLQKQRYLSFNQPSIQTVNKIKSQHGQQLKNDKKIEQVMKNESRRIYKQFIPVKQSTPRLQQTVTNKIKQYVEGVSQKEMNINQISASESIKKRRDMYIGRRIISQLHNDQIPAETSPTSQTNKVNAASNSKESQQKQNQQPSNSSSLKRQSRLKYKTLKQGPLDDQMVENKRADSISLETDSARIPTKIVALNFKNPIIPNENSIKMRKQSISPKNQQLTNKKTIESEDTNKAVERTCTPQKDVYPPRRKKVRSKTTLAIKTNRSSKGTMEEMSDQKTQVKNNSRYVDLDKDKDNKEVNIFITKIKAVLYTNHRRAPKKCIISLRNRTFKTQIEQTLASLIEWKTKFSLDNVNQQQNISCRIVSCDGNEQIEQGKSVMKGSDIFSQNKRSFKSYLYCDELAVGYIELELEKMFPNSQTRNTVSLPQIKKSSSFDDRSDKNKSSISKKSIIHMSKYSILNTPIYPDMQQQPRGISQKDKSHLTRLKQKKMKLRAKIK